MHFKFNTETELRKFLKGKPTLVTEDLILTMIGPQYLEDRKAARKARRKPKDIRELEALYALPDLRDDSTSRGFTL